ncbi:MAG: SURF1 family protein [Pseudooceanicola sp.]
MLRNLFMVGIIGLGGVAILVSLGIWQVNRLAEKEAYLANIESRIGEPPQALPGNPDPATDKFMPVTATGTIAPGLIRVLSSRKNVGAGHRLIVPFVSTDGRRILVDIGFLAQGRAVPAMPAMTMTLTGNLHWPDETDSFTPKPIAGSDLWFARDVPALAAALDTAPILIVARDTAGIDGVTPWPINTDGIPNDHRGYAITWFSLAAIWLAMTGFLVYRMRKPK